MFLDLDRFKAINDTHGHQAGDIVLKEVAARLTRCVRGVDTVSRQGGDEFVVILADIRGADQAAHVAGSVMHAVAQPMTVGEHEVTLSVSIGIASARATATTSTRCSSTPTSPCTTPSRTGATRSSSSVPR